MTPRPEQRVASAPSQATALRPDDVVVTGMSGSFPASKYLKDFMRNLYDEPPPISIDTLPLQQISCSFLRGWKPSHYSSGVVSLCAVVTTYSILLCHSYMLQNLLAGLILQNKIVRKFNVPAFTKYCGLDAKRIGPNSATSSSCANPFSSDSRSSVAAAITVMSCLLLILRLCIDVLRSRHPKY
ncbi:hypothetical protein EVAR_79829_1 [Eumeta japonica]|uniref:Fatty acid synthase n=1 Tax=Eumeta variegata TaxID=151549 RepID=A0A4C1WSR6_EUMVA|nr:hypothetical protein EVAR_79829_1 [Eumeta japonica]